MTELLKYIEFFDKISEKFDFTPTKNTCCVYGSHQIEVERDGQELRLYIDNELVESRKTIFSPDPAIAILRGTIVDDGGKAFVKVFGKSGFLRSKVKICVNDTFVAGDSF